jgi:phosphoribosylformylglycinamidine synthase
VPITGGNVSLYNETDGQAIYPTPVVGVVGLIGHSDRALTGRFQESGDVIVLLGESHGELGGSEYVKRVHGMVRGLPPRIDLLRERALQDLMVALASERLVRSATDCSDGGVAVALAECGFGAGGIGAEVSLAPADVSEDSAVNLAAALFGESASRILISVTPDCLTEVLQRAALAGVPATVVGETGGNRLRLAVGGRLAIDVAIDEAERRWATAIALRFGTKAA